jgi:excisionase family DNA binding protein
MATEADPLLLPSEVAAMWRVHRRTVTRWANEGRLTAVRTPGGHRRFRESEVRALLTGTPEEPTDSLKAPVRTLWPNSVSGPAAAVRDRLQSAGILTVGALTALSARDLKSAGLRPPQVDEVRLVLHRKGFALYGEVIDGAA